MLAAISGGVDSAVAAARLVDAGHDVVGVHLRTGVLADAAAAGGARSCCGLDDARDARQVAATLGIPFYVVDVQEAFRSVVEDFKDAYLAGRTPMPCVLCNRDVKFGRLLEVADELGASHLATGHYARSAPGAGGRMRLLVARDRDKDQTYMLFRVGEAERRRALFPIGDSLKADVRAEAARRGLAVAQKPDSQELCFLPPTGGPRAFLQREVPAAVVAGVFHEDGREVGRHDGALGFTIGQRQGLPARGERRYVRSLDVKRGVVEIAPRDALLESVVVGTDAAWVDVPNAAALAGPVRVDARIRHAGSAVPAWLEARGPDAFALAFDEPVFAPAPGQAVVAWVGDAVLVGGAIAPVAKPA